MKKVLSRKFVIFCLVASMILVAPFHIVYADGSVSIGTVNIIGVSIDGEYTTSSNNHGTVFKCILDNYYIGTFTLKLRVLNSTGQSTNITVPFYVNGNIAYGQNNVQIQSVSYVDSIVSQNLALSSKDRNTFPMESLNFVIETAGLGYVQREMLNLGTWTYPIFSVPANGEITHRFLNPNADSSVHSATLILWINKNVSSLSNISEALSITGGEFTSVDSLRSFSYNGVNGTRILKIVFSRTGNSNGNVYVRTVEQSLIMPIYCQRNGEMGLETQDFCDLFGLPYGGMTVEQEQSADDLQNEQSEFASSSEDLFQYENDFNESMNDSLDDINVNFDVGNTLGSKFLASASWVRTQFESLTSNTPFGSVLSFSLILGIALLIIGKVLK